MKASVLIIALCRFENCFVSEQSRKALFKQTSKEVSYWTKSRNTCKSQLTIKMESVKLNAQAPVRWLTQGLGLTSHPKDEVAKRENKLHKLVCDCLSNRFDSCIKGCCRKSNFGPSDPQAGFLTTRLSCSPSLYHYGMLFNKTILAQ